MEKIININIAGRIIPIEESTYEKLKKYLESLRSYFKKEEDGTEIINDIESRIAELLNEKIRKGLDVITEIEMNEVIASMGNPKDIDEALEGEQTTTTNKTENKTEQPNKRLYRNLNDKMLGGVCSGIANYFNIDPTILRILFAILFFSGWVFILYIVLWIVLPKTYQEPFLGNRIHRNPEQKILGGVASGLAAYFGMQIWTIRLIFLVPLLFQSFFKLTAWTIVPNLFPDLIFSSLSGTFAFTYIILWIVLPNAKSEYQKMEMRGEKVDVNKIRENVKEKAKEMGEDLKSAVHNLGEKTKSFSNEQGKPFVSELGQVIKTIFGGVFRAIGIVLKLVLLIIAGVSTFTLFVLLIAVFYASFVWWPVNDFLWSTGWQQTLAWSTLILFIAVPIVSFMIWAIRRVFNVRSQNSYLGWSFGGLWFLGWVSLVLFVASVSNEIRYYEHDDTNISIANPKNDKLTITVSEPEVKFNNPWGFENDANGWDIKGDSLKLEIIKFNIKVSEDSAYRLQVKKYSAGSNFNDAIARAKKIQYRVAVSENKLDLGSGFLVDNKSKYRGQVVDLELQIPVGKKIQFDKSTKHVLHSLHTMVSNHRVFGEHGERIEIEYNSRYQWDTDSIYIMGADGELKNLDGSSIHQKIWPKKRIKLKHKKNHRDFNEEVEIEEAKEEKQPLNKLKESVELEKPQDEIDEFIIGTQGFPLIQF